MRHNVTVKHLRCFLAVAETGSFTTAAVRLFLTQSALTATIQQFEEAVGMKIFDRTTRRVAMTEHAERFRPEAERVVNSFDGAIGDLMALAQSERGHIRIGAAASVIYQFLANAIPKFRESYPNITISLRDPAAQQVERLVLEGEVDFAIDSKHQGFADLDYTPLVADRYGVVCHRDLPLAHVKGSLRWVDLTPREYVAFSADTGIGQFLRSHAGHWPVLGGTHNEVASTTSLFAVLGMGKHYSILPAMALKGRALPELVFRELNDPPLVREICLITRRLRSVSPSAQRLLDILLVDIRQQRLPEGVSLLAPHTA
jgi:DNA-binding transcriptional LysR family regulator